jgi:hypothetical protein
VSDYLRRLQEIWEHYPTVRNAAAFVEAFLCRSVRPGEPSAWDEMVAMGVPPDRAAASIRRIARTDRTARAFAAVVVETGADADLGVVIAEMDLPEFDVYVRGRMGAV